MPESLKRLPTLKLKLVTATEFSDVLNYFFDHFGENEEFMGLGKADRHPLLEEVLAHSARAVLQTSLIVMKNVFIIHVPGYHFVHGAFQVNGNLANFFYFEDIDTGMMAMTPSPTSNETRFIRFSCQQLGKPPRSQSN